MPNMAGYWPLANDTLDHSGRGMHGESHGGEGLPGQFDGCSNYVQIPSHPELDPGRGDFAIAAWVKADSAATDVTGDVIGKWDADKQKGMTLSIKGSSGGYNSHGSQRDVHFGIDDADTGEWEDCGRPNRTSNYVSNSLTVFDGNLYAATSDAATPEDWAHVYRYGGGQSWHDCGRVGSGKTRGVGPMIVHNSHLYAATWSYDWTRVENDDLDACRVYRYAGGTTWEDCGQPGDCRRLYGIASYAGRLYVAAEDNCVYVYEGDRVWSVCRSFRSHVHPMAVHHGKLYAGEFGLQDSGTFRPTEIFSFDGQTWESVGLPLHPRDREDQVHALHVHQGLLHVTTWPTGKVAALQDDGSWSDCGRLGQSTEINALNVYNGKLYGGTIPLAEVYRYDGPAQWTRLGRFCPADVVEAVDQSEAQKWGRVTSLTTYSGRMYASIGSYTSSIEDAPADLRGRVFALRAGSTASYDHDIGDGWRHLVAMRRSDRLEMYLDGKLCATAPATARAYDLTNAAPLRIGFGPVDYFSGSIREVRLWKAALDQSQINQLAADRSMLPQ